MLFQSTFMRLGPSSRNRRVSTSTSIVFIAISATPLMLATKFEPIAPIMPFEIFDIVFVISIWRFSIPIERPKLLIPSQPPKAFSKVFGNCSKK